MNRIIIIGYMGAGKTTVGRALSKAIGVPFYDLDWYIEQRMRRSVRQLFDERGEEGFRRVERNMLHEVAEFEEVILSCGGGTPCFFDNMEYMNNQGSTVFLEVAPDVLFRRLRIATQQRPILRGKSDDELRSFIGEALAKRLPYYTQARYRFNGSRLEDRKQIAASVTQLRQLLRL